MNNFVEGEIGQISKKSVSYVVNNQRLSNMWQIIKVQSKAWQIINSPFILFVKLFCFCPDFSMEQDFINDLNIAEKYIAAARAFC
jgi:hypothetical protein